MIHDRNTARKRLIRRIPYQLFGWEPSHTHEVVAQHTHQVVHQHTHQVVHAHTHSVPAGTVTATTGAASDATVTTGNASDATVTTGNASDATVTSASGEALAGMDDGAPLITEVSTFGVGGIEIAAAGDSFSAWDFDTLTIADIAEPIGVRVIWIEDVTTPGATDLVTWVALYKQFDAGEAVVAAATALDTVIGSQTPGGTVGFKMRRGNRGIINANTFNEDATRGGLVWNVEADVLTNYSTNEVVFLALELDFLPRFYQISGQGPNANTSQSAA